MCNRALSLVHFLTLLYLNETDVCTELNGKQERKEQSIEYRRMRSTADFHYIFIKVPNLKKKLKATSKTLLIQRFKDHVKSHNYTCGNRVHCFSRYAMKEIQVYFVFDERTLRHLYKITYNLCSADCMRSYTHSTISYQPVLSVSILNKAIKIIIMPNYKN